MKAKSFIPLAIGLGVGFMAIRMGRDMLQRASGSQGTTQVVVVSSAEIGAASSIADSMLTTQKAPGALVPHGAFVDRKALVGRVTAAMIPPGVMITESMLAPAGTQPGLSSRIPDGFRAVAVKVDEASSVGGFITPGSYVDVSAVMTERLNNQDRTSSRIILQNVKVGAVGQSLNSTGPDGKSVQLSRSVTLLVRPEDVPRIQMAASRGQVHLALRNGRDDTGERLAAGAKSFFEGLKPRHKTPPPQKPKAAPPAPRQHIVEVYRGTVLERLVFSENGEVHRASENGRPGDVAPGESGKPGHDDLKIPEVPE
jgi:pilus assembly protein CpaB